MPDGDDATRTDAPSPRRRRRRRRRLIALLLIGLLAALAYAATRPPVLRQLVAPTLARVLGGEVELDDVRLSGLSTISIGTLRLRAPGWKGPSGDVALAHNLSVELALDSLVRGSVSIRSLSVERLRVRVAERESAPGDFNVAALKDRSRAEGPQRLTTVFLPQLELEVGLAEDDGEFVEIARRTLSGSLRPDPSRADGSLFRCTVRERDGEDLLRGTLDERTFAFEFALGGIVLDPSLLDLTPLAIRQAAKATGIGGAIRSGTIAWSPTTSLSASVEVRDIHLTLSGLDLDDRWVRLEGGRIEPAQGLPKLRVNEGTIEFKPDAISLRGLEGTIASSADRGDLVPVPVHMSATFRVGADALRNVNWSDSAARAAWLEDFLDRTPFLVELDIPNFDSGEDPTGPRGVELPVQVASAIDEFGVRRWHLDVNARFERDEPTRAADGSLTPAPVRSSGTALLSKASGAYDKFPYPLHDVEAHIEFGQHESGEDFVHLDYLSGLSTAGTSVTLRGTVENPGPEAAVALTLTAPGTPIDQTLLSCFRGEAREALEKLFSANSERSLRGAGLLADDDTKSLGARERELLHQLSSIDAQRPAEQPPRGGVDPHRQATAELARIRRMIEARPFRLGGTLDLNLTIGRAAGPRSPTIVAGSLSIDRAGVLVEEFPYPLTVVGGALTVTGAGIEIADDGLRAVTLAGGAVRVTGKIGLDQSDRIPGVRPRIAVVGVDDRISPYLLAALPPTEGEPHDGWPGGCLSTQARLIGAANLDGTIDYRVDVRGTQRQPVIDLTLADGSVRVDERGREFLLPPGLALTDVRARLRLDAQQLRIDYFNGNTDAEGGVLEFAGSFRSPVGAAEHDLQLSFASAILQPWIVELLPSRERARTRDAWRAISPQGTFDASLRFVRSPDGHDHVTGTFTPRSLTISLEGIDVSCERLDGHCSLDMTDGRGSVEVHEVALGLLAGGRGAGGILTVRGSATIDEAPTVDPVVDLEITLDHGRFESPAIAASARIGGGEDLAETVRTIDPVGRYDASARVTRSRDGEWDWSATLRPFELECTIGAVRPSLTFDGAGILRLSPQGIVVDALDATLPGGRLGLTGAVDTTGAIYSLHGAMTLDAKQLTPEISVFLPEPLASAREELEFDADELLMPHADIQVEWSPQRGITRPERYSLDAELTTTNGRFLVGPRVDSVYGSARVQFAYHDPAEGAATGTPRITMSAQLGASSLSVFGRTVTDGEAEIGLEDGNRLMVRRFDGSIAGGRLAGSGHLDIDTNRFIADVRLADAGLELLLDPSTPRGPGFRPGAKGIVDARLSIEGIAGDVPSRTGRGRIAVRNATMASSMLTLRLVELSQLAIPLTTAIRGVDIAFFIDGPYARFEQFRLVADNVDINGSGFVDTRDFTIDATFRSRGRVAIMKDIIGAVSDTLWEIAVTGPVTDPRARLVPLPALTR